MVMQAINDYMLTDLVQFEEEGTGVGYTRQMVKVTSASAQTLPLGTVVWRAKGVDPTATYAPIDDAGDIADANEYAFLIGDELQFQAKVDYAAGVARTVVSIVRGEVILKAWLIEDYLASKGITGATDIERLKHLVARQGVLIEKTYR